MENLNVGLLYISLYNQLVKRVGVGRTLTHKEFFCMIGKHFLVPKNLRPVVVKEMEDRKLVKQELNGEITVLDNDFDLENNANKFYKRVGLF